MRVETAEAYARLLNDNVTPVVHEYGSLGCSGDLAPLAHCALALMGEGPVRDASGALREAAEVVEPITLHEKEGLALINGTDGMLGMLVLAIADLRMLLTTADITAAMSVEGLLGTDRVFAADLHALRPQSGQQRAAEQHAAGAGRQPDRRLATAARRTRACRTRTRCAARRRSRAPRATRSPTRRRSPSASSPPRSTTRWSRSTAAIESNGNFHGAPVGYVLDFLAIAVRRPREHGRATDGPLPRHLAQPRPAAVPGRRSRVSTRGCMIAQYTQAALVSELKRLAAPASVDSIPSSAMQEDHVSMGWSAGRKLRRAIDGLSQVLAIELLTAARGIRLRAPLEPAAGHGGGPRTPPGARPRSLPRPRDRGGDRIREERRRPSRR